MCKYCFLLVLLFVDFIVIVSCNAVTVTSVSDNDWNVPKTWDGGIVPKSGDIVIINSKVLIVNPVICSGITINVNNSLIVNDNLTINGDLVINGTFNLSEYSSTYFNVQITGNITITGYFIQSSFNGNLIFNGTTKQFLNSNGPRSQLIYNLECNNSSGLELSGTFGITAFNLKLTQGTIYNSDKLTLGATSYPYTVNVVRGGNSTTPAGSFDKPPLINLASGDYSVIYDNSSSNIISSFEIPSTGVLSDITINNSLGVNLNQNLIINSYLNLQNGQFLIGNKTLTFNGSGIIGNTSNFISDQTTNLIFGGTSTSVSVPGNISVYSLTINNPNGITQKNSNLYIYGSLNLNSGSYKTGSGTIVFMQSASDPIESNNYAIFGRAEMISRTVGAGNLSFLGCSIANGGNIGNVTIIRKSGITGVVSIGTNSSCAVNWEIISTTPLASPRDVNFLWYSVFDNGKSFSPLILGQIWGCNNQLYVWDSIPGTQIDISSLEPRNITATLNSLGKFTPSSNDTPLPVEIISFNSQIIGRNIKLNWETTKEENNSGFEINRKDISLHNSDWTKIGFVTGIGNSNNINYYTYSDTKLNAGKYTYRLKQIDFNGNFRYYYLNSSNEILNPVNFVLFQNYPNPFNQSSIIKFQSPIKSSVSLKIYDITGREVTTLVNEILEPGIYEVRFDASALSSGIYLYTLKAGNFNQTNKLLITK